MADIKNDKTLKCKDCGEDFVFSVSEQEFFADKQFSDPSRCKNCRMKARAQHDRSNDRSGDRGERQSFPIVCAQCGAEDTVPFQPKEGGKPVLCRNCFRANSSK